MFNFIKRLLGQDKSKTDNDENNSTGNYISLATLEHIEFIVGEILKGSEVGNYNRSYAQSPKLALPGLEKQLRSSIQHNKFTPNGVDLITSIISIGHHNHEVSGFCWSTSPSHNTYEVHMLSVKEERRRAGLGKALLLDAIDSYPKGSQVIARIYKDEFKTDRSRSMQDMLLEAGFERSLEQPNQKSTLFSKQLN